MAKSLIREDKELAGEGLQAGSTKILGLSHFLFLLTIIEIIYYLTICSFFLIKISLFS
jgi:hypothetical protein